MEQKEWQYFENHFKAILEKESQSQYTASMDLEVSQGDDIDKLDREKFNQLDFRLKTRESLYFKKIRSSLQKIYDGTFGTCEDCGDQISMARLKARPTADMCIFCKEEAERDERSLVNQNRKSTQYGNILPIHQSKGRWGQVEDRDALLSVGTQDSAYLESHENH